MYEAHFGLTEKPFSLLQLLHQIGSDHTQIGPIAMGLISLERNTSLVDILGES